jgi:hypothetical protein
MSFRDVITSENRKTPKDAPTEHNAKNHMI